ncbi:hypothetical protein AB0J74_18480 [Asanoa sp. NPDC049573]|uniref:hypothetical protein n=1 Tax=Asanoa sp. NPDC049573 TaxID=3155396 RepID=UPI00344297D7
MDLNSVEGNGLSRRVVIQRSLAAGLATGLGATFAGKAAFAAAPDLSARIDVSKRQDPIQKYVYGAFIEHIGTLVYDGLWSELLGDRKFFYPIDQQTDSTRKWRPVGTAAAVTMDRHAPYVGEQSPMVALTRSERRGFAQSGLSLAAKEYVGRIVIAGDPGAQVSVTLSWGDAPGQQQSITVHVRKDWATVPLTFACRAATTNGRLEISGIGTGRFRVGAVSLMPGDNVKGFRKDTVELLREVNGGFWRFPGGNFVSGITTGGTRSATLTSDRPSWTPTAINRSRTTSAPTSS